MAENNDTRVWKFEPEKGNALANIYEYTSDGRCVRFVCEFTEPPTAEDAALMVAAKKAATPPAAPVAENYAHRLLTAIAAEAYREWDADNDMRVGKILRALADPVFAQNYRQDIEELHSRMVSRPAPAAAPVAEDVRETGQPAKEPSRRETIQRGHPP